LAIADYINTITLSGMTLAYPPLNETAEELALEWLIEDDPLMLTADTASDLFRLRQRYALSTFWFQTGGPWVHSDFWLDSDECSWFGLFCQQQDLGDGTGIQDEVSKMEFTYGGTGGDNSMHGSLPADLFLLTGLTHITLEYESLTGSIPESIGLLTNLLSLRFWFNAFTGTLPPAIGNWQRLTSFDIVGNNLSGPIPDSVGQWTGLTAFRVSHNALRGSLPESIGQWSLLTIFSVNDNALTGAIPNSVINWQNLGNGYFQKNSFNGTMPFCNAGIDVTYLHADCDEVACTCCSTCCTDGKDDCVET